MMTTGRCLVPPSPQLRERIRRELRSLRGSSVALPGLRVPEPKAPGLNDGLIIPGRFFPLGTSLAAVRRTAAERAPLRGTLRVLVVLVDFPDQPLATDAAQLRDLFFSQGVLPGGSVREYFAEVAHGLIEVVGEVVGPYRMQQPMAEYANGVSGLDLAEPNTRTMAREAAVAAGGDVEFAPFDNDGDGFVDAFIVVHAGPGAETTGDGGHLWSHKWVLSGSEHTAGGASVFAYLTVPEDARIGVCAHELGHLLFGWPDLYDTDGTSEGVGEWCLMGGGSWNAGGDVPAHPSAWCKDQQGWVDVVHHATDTAIELPDVKDGRTLHRLWRNDERGEEYFLLENRQRSGYDAHLPGDGLLIWHIDDAIESNSDEFHPKVALLQADGLGDLEAARNRGDGGDAYPGLGGDAVLTSTSTPSSRSYGGLDTCVGVTEISASGPVMSALVAVTCDGNPAPANPGDGGRLRLLLSEARDRVTAAIELVESQERG